MGQRILERLGFDVIKAQSGTEAIDVFRREKDRIRCVILDQNMPDLGGRETLVNLIEIEPELLAVLSSGYPQEAETAEEAGFRGFIQKPYDRLDLAECLRSALS